MLDDLKNALLSVGVSVYHCEAAKADNEYIVWQEVGKTSQRANNVKSHAVMRVAVDFFTKTEYDDIPDEIESALDAAGIIYDDVDIDYEKDTGVTHYAWTCEVSAYGND